MYVLPPTPPVRRGSEATGETEEPSGSVESQTCHGPPQESLLLNVSMGTMSSKGAISREVSKLIITDDDDKRIPIDKSAMDVGILAQGALERAWDTRMLIRHNKDWVAFEDNDGLLRLVIQDTKADDASRRTIHIVCIPPPPPPPPAAGGQLQPPPGPPPAGPPPAGPPPPGPPPPGPPPPGPPPPGPPPPGGPPPPEPPPPGRSRLLARIDYSVMGDDNKNGSGMVPSFFLQDKSFSEISIGDITADATKVYGSNNDVERPLQLSLLVGSVKSPLTIALSDLSNADLRNMLFQIKGGIIRIAARTCPVDADKQRDSADSGGKYQKTHKRVEASLANQRDLRLPTQVLKIVEQAGFVGTHEVKAGLIAAMIGETWRLGEPVTAQLLHDLGIPFTFSRKANGKGSRSVDMAQSMNETCNTEAGHAQGGNGYGGGRGGRHGQDRGGMYDGRDERGGGYGGGHGGRRDDQGGAHVGGRNRQREGGGPHRSPMLYGHMAHGYVATARNG